MYTHTRPYCKGYKYLLHVVKFSFRDPIAPARDSEGCERVWGWRGGVWHGQNARDEDRRQAVSIYVAYLVVHRRAILSGSAL